ncbi:putative sulfate exporter family transporter [Paenibacillus timonensis]|uniref:YeiH family protein n=1 Tax=Paenibacillus TaxID=44249 RepID=UPI0012D9DB40|nr:MULTISPECIES: putative sulfate exporter family transporter [Paenibacillus]MUG87154.1 putative sulfate exporter family transporter [Paenibacillus timonensis]GIP49125.1 membrane protein [Paenibacillus sp. J53TS2]
MSTSLLPSKTVLPTTPETAKKTELLFGGIGFTLVIAMLGFGLAQLPGFNRIGQLGCSILLAVLYRQFVGYPESLRPGIRFASQQLLRLAIVLFGLKLNLDIVLQQGLPLLARDAATIAFSIIVTLLIGKWLKADFSLSLLLGIGTGVCGAAAIAAVSPILKAKEDDTAIGAGLVAFVGTLFSVGYTLLRPLLPMSELQYGVWSGVSLHEIAHVVLAAEPAGPDALAVAILAKLGRVFLLIPLSFLLMYGMKRTAGTLSLNPSAAKPAAGFGPKPKAAIPFPWFLLGFISASVIGTYALGTWIPVKDAFLGDISTLTGFLLTMAMVGLGLNVNLRELRSKALLPLIAMLITSLLLSVGTWISLIL